jgi:multiple sugar transport system permease protein
MTATSDARTSAAPDKTPVARRQKKARAKKKGHLPTQIFLAVVAVLWIFPVGYALINSFRDYAYTSTHGYLSFGGFTLKNYRDAWEQANFSHTMLNSAIITIPAVLLTLFLSCCIAFVVARFSFKFNLALLATFTAANLLPPQALLIPVYRMFRAIEVPFWFSDSGTLLNSYWGLIAVNVAFQTGFCAFVLSNYMKTLPREMYESAVVDGAGVCRAPRRRVGRASVGRADAGAGGRRPRGHAGRARHGPVAALPDGRARCPHGGRVGHEHDRCRHRARPGRAARPAAAAGPGR